MPHKLPNHPQPNSTPAADERAGFAAPSPGHRARGNTPRCGMPTRPERRRSAVVRLLARIDRKLGLLIRQHDQPAGSFLTIAQAARLAGVSENTIRRAIRLPDGPDKLVAYDESLGRKRARWLIDPADLDAWRKRREGRLPGPLPRTVRVSTGKPGQFKF